MALFCDCVLLLSSRAKANLVDGRFDDAHTLLLKAENLVLGFASTLRKAARTDLAHNLGRLFQFVFLRLFEANVSHNPHRIDEATNLVTVLRDAWVEAEKRRTGNVSRGVPEGPPRNTRRERRAAFRSS